MDEDAYLQLHLLKEGLLEADALMLFLTASARAIQATGGADDYRRTLRQTLEHVHQAGNSGSETIDAVNKFRRVSDQIFESLEMFSRPPH